ncbi:N-(5'-phosphoribosyl)anthranilate isomerase [Saccharolobus solfataricus]|uniref:N-(5'-phosphoribosyl)anthranilate isomerase n=3 Tax=Saccharolobus solfataricus TaxID=2287 RepID=TRPF_SACS2|nr:N-(5'-phosphoribosyl)anthranilate isomerase [Saccharolobus solfataricus]P50386.1 RecName: Full=N-(5'-phosphoribosyl)anthranilate isomerase; Short=PRAI [Saccharolobus solfataricus P2]AAK41174.1 Phosphoribosyl anthranilate isomerase (trpF) [Saccharolobus solfataricus P2]AKA74128.1 N-(5'-phosphoribosyl)anthranilate isomerase [Saccharolobus solfataricus]AKA76826.1 N-(5'-phosphoribosyl)anthranilate isomerase [Saccharolobus solfataricus]AKA79519.1 N-(5'-phosphoribosyl)anthranilate isomerase [Sacc
MVKLKICGNATLSDIIEFSKLDVDYLGIITDVVSQRFVKSEFLTFVKRYVEKPIVNVKVNVQISEIERELLVSDYFQIHRVLDDSELELLKSYDFRKRIILYVPASFEYKKYLERAIDTVDMVLVDSVKKGVGVDYNVVSSFLKDYPYLGVGGKISIDNISNFIDLNPAWLDISSSIEIYPGKKDINMVKKIVEVVKYGSSSNK